MTENPTTNDAPLLVTGQTVTNGIDGILFWGYPARMLYVETLDSGTATLNYRYEGYGSADGFSCSVDLDMTVMGLKFVDDETTDYNFSPSLGGDELVTVII